MSDNIFSVFDNDSKPLALDPDSLIAPPDNTPSIDLKAQTSPAIVCQEAKSLEVSAQIGISSAPSPQNHTNAGCLKEPYPPAIASAPNESYARLIRSSFSGRDSELSAVMAYFYQSMKFCECSPDLHDTLMQIAICEMRHLELLGKLIISLGCEPKFFCCLPPNANPGGWWVAHPSIIKYTANLGEALKFDIAAEKAAIDEYKSVMNYVDDVGIKELLKRIIADEEEHIRIFSCLYLRFCS